MKQCQKWSQKWSLKLQTPFFYLLFTRLRRKLWVIYPRDECERVTLPKPCAKEGKLRRVPPKP